MGVFDYLTCQHPLPDGFDPDGIKDTDARWLDRYILREDGSLIHEPTGEAVAFHGALEFYASNSCASSPEGYATEDDLPPWSASYVALYDHGKLLRLEGRKQMDDASRWMPKAKLYALWNEKRLAAGEKALS